MIPLLIAILVGSHGIAPDTIAASSETGTIQTKLPPTNPCATRRWQVGLSGGLPQMGGLMVRWWWDDLNAVQLRGHGRASRQEHLGPSSESYIWADSGYSASGEFALDFKYLRQLVRVEGRGISTLVSPVWLRCMAYVGAGAYAYYEDRELRRLSYVHYKYESSSGQDVQERVYADEIVHIQDRSLGAVGGAGLEFGLGRISATVLLGYAAVFDADFAQYEIGPSFEAGVAVGF